MEKNQIKIIVGGRCASGKSTIASFIEAMLIERGFEVEFVKEYENDDKLINEKIKTLLDRNTKITIDECPMAKDFHTNGDVLQKKYK